MNCGPNSARVKTMSREYHCSRHGDLMVVLRESNDPVKVCPTCVKLCYEKVQAEKGRYQKAVSMFSGLNDGP